MHILNCSDAGPDSDVFWIEGDAAGVAEPATNVSFTISEFAQQFGVTPRALRFYESRGLLSPEREGAMRIYRAVDRERMAAILKGKKLGFTLAEISEMIAAREGRASARTLRMSRARCLDQINLLERQFNEVQEALAELRRLYSSLSEEPDAAPHPIKVK